MQNTISCFIEACINISNQDTPLQFSPENLDHKIELTKSRYLFCIERGKKDQISSFNLFEWRVNMKKCIDASPILAVYEDYSLVIIGSHSGLVCAISTSGKILWTCKLPDRVECSATMSTDGQAVFIGCYDGILYALEAISGKVLAVFKTNGQIKATVLVKGQRIYVASYDGIVFSLEWSNTFTVLNSLDCKGPVFAAMATANASIYIGTIRGRIIHAEETNQGLVELQHVKTPGVFSRPLLIKDKVVVCTIGKIYALDARDLSEKWNICLDVPVVSWPVLWNDKIVFGTHGGEIYLLEQDGAIAGSIKVGNTVFATVVIEENECVAATIKGEILVIDLQQQSVIRTKKIGGEVYSSPLAFKNHNEWEVIVGCRDDWLYCLKI